MFDPIVMGEKGEEDEEKAEPKQTQGFCSFCCQEWNGQSCVDIVHDNVDEGNLNGLREGVTSAVAEGREVGEADVVAVHELGQPGSQKQQNLRVCEA